MNSLVDSQRFMTCIQLSACGTFHLLSDSSFCELHGVAAMLKKAIVKQISVSTTNAKPLRRYYLSSPVGQSHSPFIFFTSARMSRKYHDEQQTPMLLIKRQYWRS